MATTTNYHPDKVILAFKGLLINGYAPDTFVEIERNEDGFTEQVGTLGDVCRTRSLNRTGTVTITLMASAAVNDMLTAIAIFDEQTGYGTGPLLMKDLNGSTVAAASTAWIRKLPRIERGNEAGTIQWIIACANLDIRAGGNVL